MLRAARLHACLAAGLVWLLAAPASAGDIYVYQASDGSRLITDHPRSESGYRLIKVYSESTLWQDTGKSNRRPVAAARARPSSFDALIRSTADRVNLDPMLIKSVMQAESAFDPNAVSRKGASGLMQLMPATARRYGVSSIFDPHQNVMGGSRYLRFLVDRFDGDLELALAGYNAGENAVDKYGGIPPYSETRHYVKKVMGLYRQYRNESCARDIDDAVGATHRIISCSASVSGRVTGGSTLGGLSVDVSTNDAALAGVEDDGGGWRHMD